MNTLSEQLMEPMHQSSCSLLTHPFSTCILDSSCQILHHLWQGKRRRMFSSLEVGLFIYISLYLYLYLYLSISERLIQSQLLNVSVRLLETCRDDFRQEGISILSSGNDRNHQECGQKWKDCHLSGRSLWEQITIDAIQNWCIHSCSSCPTNDLEVRLFVRKRHRFLDTGRTWLLHSCLANFVSTLRRHSSHHTSKIWTRWSWEEWSKVSNFDTLKFWYFDTLILWNFDTLEPEVSKLESNFD